MGLKENFLLEKGQPKSETPDSNFRKEGNSGCNPVSLRKGDLNLRTRVSGSLNFVNDTPPLDGRYGTDDTLTPSPRTTGQWVINRVVT